MKLLQHVTKNLKQWFIWGLIIYFSFILFGLSLTFPINLIVTTTIVIGLYFIYKLILIFPNLNNRIRLSLKISVWTSVLIVAALIYYVHHYLPQGPMFPTGDVICRNDDRGPCSESYIEEVRYLDIPQWAKFFKKSEGMLLFFSLFIVAFIISFGKNEENEYSDKS